MRINQRSLTLEHRLYARYRLRTMLLLRALLDAVGAVRGDLDHNINVVRTMFPPLANGIAQTTATQRPMFVSPSARTSAFVERQLGIHQRLWSMSEGYTTQDARTVRSVSVSELDEMYDIVSEACSTNLFALHSSATNLDNRQESSDADSQHQRRPVKHQTHLGTEVYERELDSSLPGTQPGMTSPAASKPLPAHRQLLLNALAEDATVSELQYLYNRLSPRLRVGWKQASVAQ